MAFTTYNEFRGKLLLLLDGDDLSASTIQPDTLDTIISLAEGLVHTGSEDFGPLRASSMQLAMAGVVGSGIVAIPTDCLELAVLWFDSTAPLEIVTEEEVRRDLAYSSGGDVRKVAQAGEALIFSPAATNGDILGGRYYAKPDPLKEGLHATFLRYPELYMYAALIVAAPVVGLTQRLPIWQGMYRSLLAQANHTERMRVFSASRLRVKAR